ncbi:MAG: metallophosphoesterase [Gammaproteobacteria bacterium]|nr:metallophosphoesterase [Gammaproteobacteria bacterium]
MTKRAKGKGGRGGIPLYHGEKWLKATLPHEGEPWLEGKRQSADKDSFHRRPLREELHRLCQRDKWRWPEQTVYFFSDLHADREAFLASLVASGGVAVHSHGCKDFSLTHEGKKGLFLVGGDCFDKGPSNLQLMKLISRLVHKGARVRLLAGNHDVRMRIGISSVNGPKSLQTEHFFVRMGHKVVPFLKEIYDHYLTAKDLQHLPNEQQCRKLLYPSKRWFRDFPKIASWVMPDKVVAEEVARIRDKRKNFERYCEKFDLSLRDAYAASLKWQELFLNPRGEFYWFYHNMHFTRKEGGLLFLHAGMDDYIAGQIAAYGVKQLNKRFWNELDNDPFNFYYGPLANAVRTKYRETDRPFSRVGARALHEKGIHLIVHGHKRLQQGQKLMLRQGMVNFECDTTLNINSRRQDGLEGYGAAVTIIRPQGEVLGVSSDYPKIKRFSFSECQKGERR